MPMVWLKARAAFTFQGRPLAIDDVFCAQPIEAVQLRARRLVEFARKPPTVTVEQIAAVFGVPKESLEEPPVVPARRPRGRPRKSVEPSPMDALGTPMVVDEAYHPIDSAWQTASTEPDDAA